MDILQSSNILGLPQFKIKIKITILPLNVAIENVICNITYEKIKK